jgi:hypothetical protein
MAEGIRSVIQGVLWVPGKIEIKDGFLLASGGAIGRRRSVSPTMLEEFIEIGITGEESKLLRFARRYGPIGFCKHGLPYGHNRQSFARLINVRDCHPMPSPVPKWDQGEAVTKWFAFAKQARAIWVCSASLHRGEQPELDDLKTVYPPWLDEKLREQSRPNMATSRGLVEGAINTWVHLGGLHPHFRWDRSGCSVIFSTGDYCSVFGALAVQLMLAAANQEGFAICSGCGMTYFPKRRPNPRRRRFCRKCGTRAAWRYSKQDLRSTLKD